MREGDLDEEAACEMSYEEDLEDDLEEDCVVDVLLFDLEHARDAVVQIYDVPQFYYYHQTQRVVLNDVYHRDGERGDHRYLHPAWRYVRGGGRVCLTRS